MAKKYKDYKKKPITELKTYQRKQAATLKRKANHEALKKRRQLVDMASKQAVEELATQAFGEGGLTPARIEALSAVVVGPEGGELSFTSPLRMRVFLNKAKAKFNALAEEYVDVHLASVKGALAAEEFDVAARHSEWAMEAFGAEEEARVAEPVKKMVAAAPASAPIMVGVHLGGVPQSDKP